jgi:hypothetical protein
MITMAEAVKTTSIHRVAGRTGDHRIPADLVGVEATHAAQVGRRRTPTPAGETARCPYLRLPLHVMGASPNREDTRNTYE